MYGAFISVVWRHTIAAYFASIYIYNAVVKIVLK